MAKRNILAKMLSFITYKDKQEPEEFMIPAANENEIRPSGKKQPGQNEDSKKTREKVEKAEKTEKTESTEKSGKTEKTGKTGKKPTPVQHWDRKSKDKREKNEGYGIYKDGQRDGQYNISKNIDDNINFIKDQFNFPANNDIVIREFLIAGRIRSFIANLDGMADRTSISDFILRPLLNSEKLDKFSQECPLEYILYSVIETDNVKKVLQPNEVINEILSGNTVIYMDGCDYCLACETRGYEKRPVEKPQVEGVVKGPQEGFTENLRTNITLVRRIIKNKDLVAEMLEVGDRNKVNCAIVYLSGLVNPAIVAEVKRRIQSIRTDAIIGEGMLEQFIEDSPWSIIPSILSTERPDRTSSHLLEGRVAIMVDGTPFTLIVPVTVFALLSSPEDTSLRWQYGTLLRFIRMFAVFVSTLLPGMYLALTNFHREMIPTDLLIAIAKARENVPFPTIFEVILMEISFELIREAGIRIPGIIGNTIGIIGALILGQAAVQASLVSPVLIIIVAFTGLGNFAIPDFNLAFGARLMRIVYIILGGSLGFFGISLGMVLSLASISSLKSFGMPVLSVAAPKTRQTNDFFIRKPIWKQEMRPDGVNALDDTRQPFVSRKWIQEHPAAYENDERGQEEDKQND